MLLNIVKIRYNDAPVFLDVASVISSYAMEEQVNFGFNWSQAAVANFQNVGGYGRYTDRPTITYNPLMGEKFARSLMTPIPPPALLSMMQAGYRADMVLRVAVNAINRHQEPLWRRRTPAQGRSGVLPAHGDIAGYPEFRRHGDAGQPESCPRQYQRNRHDPEGQGLPGSGR